MVACVENAELLVVQITKVRVPVLRCMNRHLNHVIHIARETRMYLHCVQIGEPRGSVYISGKQRKAAGKKK